VYPQGMFLSGAFTVQSTLTDNVTAISDLLLLEAALPLRHRMAPGAAMFMSRSTQRQLEALDTGGYYFKRPGQNYALGSAIPQNSLTGNTGTQLLGYPIWEVPSAVSTLTTDAAVIVVFGDPKNYVIVDRIGMNVEVIQNMLNGATPSFPTGQRGIYAYWRATARALNVDGMRQLDVN
jgi:HK97 family phage major capsid protein